MTNPRSKYNFFTAKKETWDPDAEQITVKLDPERSNGGGTVVKFEEQFYILDGTETLELFLIWWMEFLDKINDKEELSHKDKIGILKRAVSGSAKEVLLRAIKQLGEDISKHK